MGLVILDLNFRLERAFKLQLGKDLWVEWLEMKPDGSRQEKTLEETYHWLLQECAKQGVTPPPDSWVLFATQLADASGLKPAEISRDMLLIRDIAPYG